MKKPILRRLFWGAAVLATLAALFYAEENWRGARALKRALDDLRAKGEPLTAEELLSHRDPAGDLSRAAIFSGWFAPGSTARPYRLNEGKEGFRTGSLGSFKYGTECDLQATQRLLRSDSSRWPLSKEAQSPGRDIVDALGRWEGDFSLIRSEINREGTYWPVAIEKGFSAPLPHLSNLLNIAKAWTIEGEARLANGEPEKAAGDFIAILDLADSIERSPLLVSHLFAVTLREMSLDLLWQGLRWHAWREADLVEIEARLARGSLFDAFVFAERGERISFLSMKGRGDWKPLRSAEEAVPERWKAWQVCLLGLAPAGWLDSQAADVVAFHQETIESVFIDQGRLRAEAFVRARRGRGILVSESMEVTRNMIRKTAQAETEGRLARIACFLERYRLHHGAYPEVLAAISDLPPGLDREIVADASFIYRKEGARYRLYSVGWNRVDDGGKIGKGEEGDWNWAGP